MLTTMGCQIQGTRGQVMNYDLAFQHKLHASNLSSPHQNVVFWGKGLFHESLFQLSFRFKHKWYSCSLFHQRGLDKTFEWEDWFRRQSIAFGTRIARLFAEDFWFSLNWSYR
jgi:hypothetical protein